MRKRKMGDWNWKPQPRRAPAERNPSRTTDQRPEGDQNTEGVNQPVGTQLVPLFLARS